MHLYFIWEGTVAAPAVWCIWGIAEWSLQHLEPDPAHSSEPSQELLCLLCIFWVIALQGNYLCVSMCSFISYTMHKLRNSWHPDCSACSLWPPSLFQDMTLTVLLVAGPMYHNLLLSLPRTWVQRNLWILYGNCFFSVHALSHSLVHGIFIHYSSAAYWSLLPGRCSIYLS